MAEAQYENGSHPSSPSPRRAPLKSGSRRKEVGTLNRRKIPGSCKPQLILLVRREDGLLKIQQWRVTQQIQGIERQTGAREWSFQGPRLRSGDGVGPAQGGRVEDLGSLTRLAHSPLHTS